LFLDLGDVFTKGLAQGAARRERVRFPSVVARALLRGGGEMTDLALNDEIVLPRLSEFDKTRYPRTRSFRGSDDFVRVVQTRRTVRGARYAGGIAAVYGADRQLLGLHPTHDNVDALVRKALLLCAPAEPCSAEIVFVIDTGIKADTILRYADARPREIPIDVHNYRQMSPKKMHVSLQSKCIDAVDCVRAALPHELAIERVGRMLIVDIGYLRSKFALLSNAGCEHQQVEALGVSDCVYRILRDGQEQGLVEDEFAIIRALESHRPERFEIAGRSFDVRRIFESARRALEDELFRIARRIVLDTLARTANACSALVIMGGGAAVVGSGLAERLKLDLALRTTWVGGTDGGLLLEGARHVARAA
jgi:hypothetical protein